MTKSCEKWCIRFFALGKDLFKYIKKRSQLPASGSGASEKHLEMSTKSLCSPGRIRLALPPPKQIESSRNARKHRVRANLFPDGRLCHNPLLGPLKFPPAVALPLLAQMSPRVGGLLKEEQEAAAAQVENQWREH